MFTIPNMLSVFRLVLIPVFLNSFFKAQTQIDYYVAAAILVVSGLTDTLDGWIARKFQQTSELGKVLDPIADKLTLFAVMIALWVARPAFWPLFALFIGKEFCMLLGFLFLRKRRLEFTGAKWFGKLSTVLFYVVVIIIIAVPDLPDTAVVAMLSVLLLFMLFSLVRYGLLLKRQL